MNCSRSHICFLGFSLLLMNPSFAKSATLDRSTWRVEIFAGAGSDPDARQQESLKLNSPFGVNLDRHDNAFLVEMVGNRLLEIGKDGSVRTLAGNGMKGDVGDGGPSERSQVNGPHNLTLASTGDLYFADSWNNRIRWIEKKSGVIRSIAGTGKAGFSGDGEKATMATMGGVYGVVLDAQERNLYFADLDNRRVRAVQLKTGLIRTVAGTGEKGVPIDDSMAMASPLVDPRGVAVDRNENVYILERGGNAMRIVDRSGRIRTLVGASGKPGLASDSEPGLTAHLRSPKDLTVDLVGSILIADSDNHCIRRYDPRSGILSRVIGTGTQGSGGIGGPPGQCSLNQPHGIWVHPKGDLFISDSSNHRILRLRNPNK